ncbi:hypothetical protein FOA52_014578 [Chlamydomonas sp. UWO 241]|nr:hypothetical protein FOA52_014578 [Chlamydomonas sp. UWO 241]
MKATANGRALPPRPYLMVGDEVACRKEWWRLRGDSARFLLDEGYHEGGPEQQAADPWTDDDRDALVWRLRSIRESLVSIGAVDGTPYQRVFCCEVYEASADVCACARNYPELLKCMQALVAQLHPSLAAAPAGATHKH